MTGTSQPLDPKDPDEVVDIEMDFKALVTSATNAQVAIERVTGTPDPAPATMLSGGPTVSGTIVRQRIVGGVDGADYLLRFQADGTDGQRFVAAAALSVRTASA